MSHISSFEQAFEKGKSIIEQEKARYAEKAALSAVSPEERANSERRIKEAVTQLKLGERRQIDAVPKVAAIIRQQVQDFVAFTKDRALKAPLSMYIPENGMVRDCRPRIFGSGCKLITYPGVVYGQQRPLWNLASFCRYGAKPTYRCSPQSIGSSPDDHSAPSRVDDQWGVLNKHDLYADGEDGTLLLCDTKPYCEIVEPYDKNYHNKTSNKIHRQIDGHNSILGVLVLSHVASNDEIAPPFLLSADEMIPDSYVTSWENLLSDNIQATAAGSAMTPQVFMVNEKPLQYDDEKPVPANYKG